jgi:hypothetical protein
MKESPQQLKGNCVGQIKKVFEAEKSGSEITEPKRKSDIPKYFTH